MKKIFIITFFSLTLLLQTVLASGVSITPARLLFKTTARQPESQELELTNITASPLLYVLYSDQLTDQVSVNPNSLKLNPGESEKVTVTVKAKKPGIYLTDLSVLSQNLDKREFNALAGIKVPLEIRATAPSFNLLDYWWILALALSFVLVVWLVIRLRRKKSVWERMNLLRLHKNWWRRLLD